MSERPISLGELMPGLSVDGLFKTAEAPPPPRPEGRGDFIDLGVAPGLNSWLMWRFEAATEVPMHHTDTVDFDLVMSGSIELTLDDGVHRLESGDCVVMTGVDHAWRAGPDGCLMISIAIGTPPPR